MNSEPPEVSIIIVNYNGEKVIEPCLRSVLGSNYPSFEIILVDNASTDLSLDLVKNRFGDNDRIKIVHNVENLGFTGGNNIGVKYASGQFIVLLSNDTEVDASWLTHLVKILKSDPSIAIVQSLLLLYHDRHKVEGGLSNLDLLGYGTERAFAEDRGTYHEIADIFYANGASMAINRNALMKASSFPHIFDEDYFMYYEDVDLCWRLRLAGYRVVIAPNSVVYHHKGYSSSRQPDRFVFFHTRNRIMTLIKNYSIGNLFKYLPILISLEIIRALVHVVTGRPSFGVSIVKGIMWNLFNIRTIWFKRLRIQLFVRSVDDRDLTRCMERPNVLRLYRNFSFYRRFSQRSVVIH